MLPPGPTAEWLYVRPLSGHAIVNLGDAMVKFTNGLLRSNIHQVVSPPGLQAECTRWSLAYFLRPGDEVVLKRLEGSAIPGLGEGEVEEEVRSKDWITGRAMVRRTGGFDREKWERFQGTERLSARSRI